VGYAQRSKADRSVPVHKMFRGIPEEALSKQLSQINCWVLVRGLLCCTGTAR
jgi:hypothetical protein